MAFPPRRQEPSTGQTTKGQRMQGEPPRPNSCLAVGRGLQHGALFALLLVLLPFSLVLAVDVPATHPVYPFLDRCQRMGVLDVPLSQTRPYSRRDVAERLDSVAEHRNGLSAVDRERLGRYLYEFKDELPDASLVREVPEAMERFSGSRASAWPWHMSPFYNDPRHFYRLKRPDALLTFDPHVDMGVELVETDSLSGTLKRAAFGGVLRLRSGSFAFQLAVRDAHLLGESDLASPGRYPIRFYAEREDQESGGFDFDEADAQLSYQRGRISLFFGKGHNTWGPGRSGSLILSDHATTYTHFRLSLRLEPIRYTYMHGKLVQDPPVRIPLHVAEGEETSSDGSPEYELADKWIVGNRLDILLGRRLQVGLYDLLIYGARGFDPEYALPMNFLWSAEHYNRDRDNVHLGIDLRYLPGFRSELYAQLYLDEFSAGKLTSDWHGNKYGLLLGGAVADPLGIPGADLRAEYVLLRPFVYTHFERINVHQHYGVNLGYDAPPNSDVVDLQWRQQLRSNLACWGGLRHMRHGATPADGRNVGGDVLRGLDEDEDESAHFLEGDRETLTELSLGVRWEPAYQVFVQCSGTLGFYERRPEGNARRMEETRTRAEVAVLWNPSRWLPGL